MKRTFYTFSKRTAPTRMYTLKVTLIEGPVTRDFAGNNPEVSRTIRIGGTLTLADFHREILRAFDRTDDQPYEFQFDHPSPNTGKQCFSLPNECRDIYGAPIDTGDATKTTIDSIGIAAGDHFGYWFDFICGWLHRITVLSVADTAVCGGVPFPDAPVTVEQIGDSPPQRPGSGDLVTV